MKDLLPQNYRILIVDDVPNNIKVIGTILREKGYQINIAKNGVEALHVVANEIPDLILLDVMMPEMGGFETCRQLKSNPNTKDIPIIFLTARTETDDIIKGFEAGAVDYITKPFNATELLIRINNHLESQYQKKIIEQQSRERQELIHILCHDLANPLNFIVSTLETIQESHELFAELSPQLACGARNGLHLIDLVRNMGSLDEKGILLEKVNLQSAVFESVEILRSRFEGKQQTVQYNIPVELEIISERTSLINSVLSNLISNAIKFSNTGVEILLNAETFQGQVLLKIKDQGVGIRQEILNDIFDISRSTSTPGTGDEKGTGFGMPVVKKFLDAYQAKIQINSVSIQDDPDNHGTEIFIYFKKA